MKLLVVGAGATGGYLGGRLVGAGRDVTFLVRAGRAAEVRDSGLRIVSPLGDVLVQPKLLTADALTMKFDAILLTVKSYQLEGALSDLAPAVGPETMIVPVLNGMRHMDVLAERFSAKNIVGCALKVATRLEDGGGIVQLSPVQDFAYGELDGSASDRIRRLDGFLQDAGVNARLSSAILREMWEKWILLAGLGAITCLMRGAIGEVEAVSEGAPFSSAILDEVIAVVTAVGVAPSSDFVTSARAQLTASGSPMTSSLYRDLEAGHPVEVDAIIGDLLERGEAAAVETPLLRASHIHLKVYQNRIAKRG